MTQEDLTMAAYQRNLAHGRLSGSRCLECGEHYLPPRPICSRCHAAHMEQVDFKGDGAIAGFTSVSVPGPAMAAKGHGRDNPYVTALITLGEGPGIAARVAAPDPESPDGGVRVGMPVAADFVEDRDDDEATVTLVFKPR